MTGPDSETVRYLGHEIEVTDDRIYVHYDGLIASCSTMKEARKLCRWFRALRLALTQSEAP